MELFVDGFFLLTIFVENSLLDVWLGSEYASLVLDFPCLFSKDGLISGIHDQWTSEYVKKKPSDVFNRRKRF